MCRSPFRTTLLTSTSLFANLKKQTSVAKRVSTDWLALFNVSLIVQEASRKAVHEELEVETIETGKLRHQLLRQHDDILAEISGKRAGSERRLDRIVIRVDDIVCTVCIEIKSPVCFTNK